MTSTPPRRVSLNLSDSLSPSTSPSRRPSNKDPTRRVSINDHVTTVSTDRLALPAITEQQSSSTASSLIDLTGLTQESTGLSRTGTALMKSLSKRVPKTLIEGFQHNSHPVFVGRKVSAWTLRYEDGELEREFVRYYNERFSVLLEKLGWLVILVVLGFTALGLYSKTMKLDVLFGQGIIIAVCLTASVLTKLSRMYKKTFQLYVSYQHYAIHLVSVIVLFNYLILSEFADIKKVMEGEKRGFQTYVQYTWIIVILGSVLNCMQTFMLSCILVWVIFGNYALLNLYVPASSPLNFLTPLFLYLTCFCNTLFAVYTRELRLRHIFLLERDIAQARMQTMGLVSSSSTDELYRTRMEKESLRGLPLPPDSVESLSPFKNMEEKPNRVQLPSLKPEPRKVGILGRVWGKLQKMGRLQDMKLENEFLAWQHDQVIFLFRCTVATEILNEVIRAIVDGVTYCDFPDDAQKSTVFCFESGKRVRDIRISYYVVCGVVALGGSFWGAKVRDGKGWMRVWMAMAGALLCMGHIVILGKASIQMETDSTEDRVFQCGFLTTFMLFTTSYSLRFRDLLVFAVTLALLLFIVGGVTLKTGTLAWVVLTFMCALLLIGMYNGAGEMELRRHFVLKEVLFPAESGGRSGDGKVYPEELTTIEGNG